MARAAMSAPPSLTPSVLVRGTIRALSRLASRLLSTGTTSPETTPDTAVVFNTPLSTETLAFVMFRRPFNPRAFEPTDFVRVGQNSAGELNVVLELSGVVLAPAAMFTRAALR